MLKNVGAIDQVIRIVAGIALMIGACFVHRWWCLIAVPGAIFAITGFSGRCPAYLPFGISTRRA